MSLSGEDVCSFLSLQGSSHHFLESHSTFLYFQFIQLLNFFFLLWFTLNVLELVFTNPAFLQSILHLSLVFCASGFSDLVFIATFWVYLIKQDTTATRLVPSSISELVCIPQYVGLPVILLNEFFQARALEMEEKFFLKLFSFSNDQLVVQPLYK